MAANWRGFLPSYAPCFYHSIMSSDSIVVMEDGAGWPAWVDEEAGAVSSVVVLAKQRGESTEQFESRARGRLSVLAERTAPRRGVLICGPGRSQPASSRERVVRVLLDVIGRGGGGEVVLVGEDRSLLRRLADHVQELNRAAPISLRLRPAPSEDPRSVARRVA
jgi:hypothetical protein